MRALPQALRVAMIAIGFSAGLAATAALFQNVTPVPRMLQVSDKLDHYRESNGRYSALFFGSSKIYHGFIPEIFDAELERAGQPSLTFNIGADGMAFPESAYLCEQVLAERPPGLRYVFLELTPSRVRIPAGFRGTRRLLYWHDWARSSLLMRTAWRDAPTWRALFQPLPILAGQTPAGACLEHFALFYRRFLGQGNGAEMVQDKMGSPRPAEKTTSGRDRWQGRGYFPIFTTMPEKEKLAWQRMVDDFWTPRGETRDLLAENAYLALDRKVSAAGAQLILVVFPNFAPNRRIFYEQPDSAAPPVFFFDRPEEFPQLYTPENRENETHLNDAGSREFSKAAAARFLAWLAKPAQGRIP